MSVCSPQWCWSVRLSLFNVERKEERGGLRLGGKMKTCILSFYEPPPCSIHPKNMSRQHSTFHTKSTCWQAFFSLTRLFVHEIPLLHIKTSRDGWTFSVNLKRVLRQNNRNLFVFQHERKLYSFYGKKQSCSHFMDGVCWDFWISIVSHIVIHKL